MAHTALGRQMATVFTVALLASACSSGSADDTTIDTAGTGTTSAPSPTTTVTEAGSSGDTAATAPPASSGSESGGEVNRATVTIGDQTFLFKLDEELATQCIPDLYGSGVVGAGYEIDGDGNLVDGGAAVSIQITPQDWEERGLDPPFIEVDGEGDDVGWQTGNGELAQFDADHPELADARVTRWTLENGYAEGDAIFVLSQSTVAAITGGELEFVDGSFEVRCGTG